MANNGKLLSIYVDGHWRTFGTHFNDNSFPYEIVRAPSSYKGYSTTIVSNARNSKGIVVSDIVIEDVAKIELSWKFLTIKEFSDLSKLFLSKYSGSFFVPVAFFNETLGDYDGKDTEAPSILNDVRIFYPNDRVADVAEITLDSDGKPIGYTNVSLHLIDTGKRYTD